MIREVATDDLSEIRQLIEAAIRKNVASTAAEAEFLLDDIGHSLDWWLENPSEALHLKYEDRGQIVGVILIKRFWNLTNLFVAPSHQRRGIGEALVRAGLEACRHRSPRSKIQVNSSSNAVGFYEAMGFKQTGAAIDRPGGCVPFEHGF